MKKLSTGYDYNPGKRSVYEDRVTVDWISTDGGLDLCVAAVADGVGGENKGEYAAQLAMDALFRYFKQSKESLIPTLLSNAVQAANRAVHAVRSETDGASCTLAVAVFTDANLLFVANVGDSRIYLVRGEKLTQLTLDHTFANIMPLRGKMSKKLAQQNPRADVLMWALGQKERVPVDIGFHVGTDDFAVANERGKKGLPLQQGDSILVCSDGLIKASPSGEPYTTEGEIVSALNRQEGDDAARTLVSFALGRDADDNVSVAVVQMPDPKRAALARRPLYLVSIAAVFMLLVASAIIITLVRRGDVIQQSLTIVEETATQSARGVTYAEETRQQDALFATETQEAAAYATSAVAQTIAAYTPTPSPTPLPTPIPRPAYAPGQIGFTYIPGEPGNEPTIVQERVQVVANVGLLGVQINDAPAEDEDDASFYLSEGSRLVFDRASSGIIEIVLYEGSVVFADAGRYNGGIEIELELDRDHFLRFDGCVSIAYPVDEPEVVFSCYDGICEFDTEQGRSDNLTLLAAGEQLLLGRAAPYEAQVRRIPVAQAVADARFISRSSFGLEDAAACLQRYLPAPTPVPPTPTISVPTITPRPTNTPSLPTPTNTPTPRPATSTPTPTPRPATSTPKPTNTPSLPTPTNTPTPRPATSTPTPTDTPVPPPPTPTDTPVPPTPTPTDIPTPTPTDIPTPTPTDIPMPTPTDIPMPTPTDTPVPPPPTDTPMPTPTETPVPPPPTPTNTPVTPTIGPPPPTPTP